MYKCEHFRVEEFVPPAVYKKRGDKAWQCMDRGLLMIMDDLRELFDAPITINNWVWGGDRQWSGLRTPDSSYYSNTSQHAYGRAVDFLVKGIDAHTARKMIDKWFKENKNGIANLVDSVTLEEGPSITWVHLDVRNNESGVNKFYV